jgi:hypothetical protein
MDCTFETALVLCQEGDQPAIRMVNAGAWEDLTAGSYPRRFWVAVGGEDESFKHWGMYGKDFITRMKAAGATYRNAGYCIHFDHDRPDMSHLQSEYAEILKQRIQNLNRKGYPNE